MADSCTGCGRCVEVLPARCLRNGRSKALLKARECMESGACARNCDYEAITVRAGGMRLGPHHRNDQGDRTFPAIADPQRRLLR